MAKGVFHCMKFRSILFFLLCLFACKEPLEQVGVRVPNSIETSGDLDCLPQDSIINDSSKVRYISRGESFDVLVSLNKYDTTAFSDLVCDVPSGLYPVIHLTGEGFLLLKQGTGQHYRKIYGYNLIGNKIAISHYEASNSDLAEHNVFAYKTHPSSSVLYIEETRDDPEFWFDGERVITKTIPEEYKDLKIEVIDVMQDSIYVVFESEESIGYSLD